MNMRTRDRTTGTEQSRLHSASDLIKEFILSHQLQTGSPLPSEARLCEALGISRSSLREGIKRLEALDIVEVQHGNGTFVGKMSLSPLVEALSFRAGVVAKHNRLRLPEMVQTRYYLELGLAETVCARLDGTEQAGLEALVEEMLEKAEHDEDFSRNDFAFHDGILALVDNDVTRQVISSFWAVHRAAAFHLPAVTKQQAIDTALAHRLILNAAQDGDVTAYRNAIKLHYKPLFTRINQAKLQEPNPRALSAPDTAEND